MMPGYFETDADIGHAESGLQVRSFLQDVLQNIVGEFLKRILIAWLNLFGISAICVSSFVSVGLTAVMTGVTTTD